MTFCNTIPVMQAVGPYLHPLARMLVWGFLSVVVAGGCGGPEMWRANIQSDNPDERILAIRAAAEAEDASSVPLLVDRLEDEDSAVRFFAILALEKITGERFGYDYAKSAADRARSVAIWRSYVRGERRTASADAQGRGQQAGKAGSPVKANR